MTQDQKNSPRICFGEDTNKAEYNQTTVKSNLTHILIPEFHPYHHFGAEVLQRAFPDAQVVATKSVTKDIVYSADDKIQLWGNLFGKDVPNRLYFPMPLFNNFLEIEG